MTDYSETDNVLLKDSSEIQQWTLSIDDDEPAVFNMGETQAGRHNGRVEICWINPKQPLTLIIKTGGAMLVQHKIVFKEKCLQSMSKVFAIIDGKEIEKGVDQDNVAFHLNSNDQAVVKLVPPEGMTGFCTLVYDMIIIKSKGSGC